MIEGPIGHALRSKAAGRIALGAFVGVLFGTLPLALLTPGGSFSSGIWIALVGGGLVGYFYHRGYSDAEHYWQEQRRTEQEMLEEARRQRYRTGGQGPSPTDTVSSRADTDMRVFDELRKRPFDGPNGRMEPGDRVVVKLPRSAHAPSRPDELDGRYVGTQLVNRHLHLVVESSATDEARHRTLVPVEEAARLRPIAPEPE